MERRFRIGGGIHGADLVHAAALLVSAGLLCSGCAVYQNVGVESIPEGAEVFVDGDLAGQTPLRIAVGRTLDHSVFVKKDGYRAEMVVLRRNDPPDRLLFLTPADVRVRLTRIDDPERPVDGEPAAEEIDDERRRRREVQVEVED